MEPRYLDDTDLPAPSTYVWTPPRKFQDRVWLHALLFVLTVASTTWFGGAHYESFLNDFSPRPVHLSRLAFLIHGLWYSGTILAILGCHEMGHYLACRYYDVNASLPFFIPVPPPLLIVFGIQIPPPIVITGTLGAFIRIREPIPTKRMLFDIGIAGPIAGFLVAVPTLFLGVWMSHVIRLPAVLPPDTLVLGEPLLFKLASQLFWGTPPDGYALNTHPMAFGAWFGLLATALNLFPVGQLDGGHISYAVLGRKSSYVTLLMIAASIGLTVFFSPSWFVWTTLMIAMLFLFGRHHPRTIDEDVPLNRARLVLALIALLMFIACFTPAPIQLPELIKR